MAYFVFKLLLVFILQAVHTILHWIFNFDFAIFNDIFLKISNSPLYPVEKPKTSVI